MLTIRKSHERGRTQTDWLDSFHSFSFADYFDPKFMHFGDLRVINEDFIEKAKGFGRHPHRNMEIITYVVHGSLEHKDSLGTGSVIRPGEIQRMTAGSGILHSEFNASQNEKLHLLQIWILPEETGLEPSYEQKPIPQKQNELILIGSNTQDTTGIKIHQDVKLYSAYFKEKATHQVALSTKRIYWLQLIKGEIKVNNQLIKAGDSLAIQEENKIDIESLSQSEFLFFDLRA